MFNLKNLNITFEEKAQYALASHLGLLNNLDSECLTDITDLENYQHYGQGVVISLDGEEWAVYLEQEEAEEAAKESITQTLWAFNSEFLASETGLDVIIFQSLSEKYEEANEAIEKLIESTCGLDDFVQSAISSDGLGHFLSSYDGEEVDLYFGDESFIAIRIN